jgi:hypothetical protein
MYQLPGSLDIVTNRAQSKSYIAVLSDEEKSRCLGILRKSLREGKTWYGLTRSKVYSSILTELMLSLHTRSNDKY